MTATTPTWKADAYQADNTGQFETALEALMQAGAHLHTGGRFADIGCGSGELAAAMAQRGFEVTANDASPSMVDAVRERCAGLPVTAEVQDAHELTLPATSFEVVHSSWMLHWLADAGPALRAMARATTPGGLVVLQYSCGQPRAAGFALRDVTASVVDRPRWRERLAAVPLRMNHHPLDETCATLTAEGLEVLLTDDAVRVPGGEDLVSLRRALRAAAFHDQAQVLGDDADDFIDQVIQALLEAGALNPHNVRVIARRPLPAEKAAPARPRGAVRAFPLSVGELHVVRVEDQTPQLRRIDFRTDGAAPLPLSEPAETLTAIWPAEGADRVVLPEVGRWKFPPDAPRQHTANLTVRAWDPATATLTVDFYLHGEHGPAARWAAAAQPGDRLGFGGTRVHWVHDPGAAWTLLLGDETVLPSVAAIVETLPADQPIIAVLEVDDPADRAYLDTSRLTVHWTARGGLEGVVRSVEFPAGRAQVFGGAETRVIQVIRTHLLTERGLGRDEVSLQGYWHRPRA
ncbi:hypothetical protein L3i22_066040 [Actinoplanes sp. L3-i22]|nr:hypothetical protein L3i22_066040 [Actinoplanes sp. L3-i22]